MMIYACPECKSTIIEAELACWVNPNMSQRDIVANLKHSGEYYCSRCKQDFVDPIIVDLEDPRKKVENANVQMP